MADIKEKISIEILNKDCLSTIFSNLSIIEKIKIERVNMRWNEVSKSSWNKVKKLDLHPACWGFKLLKQPKFLLDEPKEKIITLSQLSQVLKRCGKFLEEIDVTKMNNNETLNTIALYCPNIKILEASGKDTLNTVSIIALAENCKNIVELRLGTFDKQGGHIYDEELSYLFKNNKNLRILEIYNTTSGINGSCFLNLPLIETLEYDIYNELEEQHLVNAIKMMENLKVFNVNLSDHVIINVVKTLQNCSNLEELYLGCSASYVNEYVELGILFKNNPKLRVLSLTCLPINIDCFSNLRNDCLEEFIIHTLDCFNYQNLSKYSEKFRKLSKFDFTYNMLNNIYYNPDALAEFVNSLVNLKSLKIYIDEYIEDIKNYTEITSLTNLEELELNNQMVTNENLKLFLENLRNLKKLSLSCRNLTDSGLYAITSLPKLEELEISEMHEITDKGFNKMENLKKFTVKFCYYVTKNVLKKILSESKKLEFFYATLPQKDQKDLLLYASEITKKNKNKLRIILDELKFHRILHPGGQKNI